MVLTGKLPFSPPSFDKILENTKFQCHHDERYVAGIGIYVTGGHVSLFKNGTVVIKGVSTREKADIVVEELIKELNRINSL